MVFKELEIQGFKSFPDKVKITFGEGVTGVVGPNGSGKSNLSDAVRWVLGETSARQLRAAGKMEDVIFGGTRRRGAMGFAQVRLTLDNSAHTLDLDADEAVIGRRYYRSGESEYSINGQVCRLKDVYELLLDTGIGRDGYSVIGQGRIAEIEREKYPLYRAERENDENIKALRRMTIKKGLFERRENFERRVKELREKKARLRREYRYTARVLQERIDKISARQAAEREKQKKLRKSYEDFLKLLNFVVLVEKDDFWRSEIVQIVVAKGPDGAPEIELVPRTGSHTVIFGSPDDAEEKLAKLLTFYRRGLRNIGWEEYRTINVKYKEQVVCTK